MISIRGTPRHGNGYLSHSPATPSEVAFQHELNDMSYNSADILLERPQISCGEEGSSSRETHGQPDYDGTYAVE